MRPTFYCPVGPIDGSISIFFPLKPSPNLALIMPTSNGDDVTLFVTRGGRVTVVSECFRTEKL